MMLWIVNKTSSVNIYDNDNNTRAILKWKIQFNLMNQIIILIQIHKEEEENK